MTLAAEERKADLVQRLAAEAQKRGGEPAAHFVWRYFALVAPEDIIYTAFDTLLGSALSLWEFGKQRRPGCPNVRLFNPTADKNGWSLEHRTRRSFLTVASVEYADATTESYLVPLALLSGDAAARALTETPSTVLAKITGARKGAIVDGLQDDETIEHLGECRILRALGMELVHARGSMRIEKCA